MGFPPKKKKNGRCRQVAVSGSSTVQCVNNFVADCRRCRYVACFFVVLVANKLHNFGCEWKITYIFW